MDLSPRPAPALLVDGENLSRDHAADVLKAARRFGEPLVRRVYGNLAAISGWEELGFRLCPTRPGKNAADMLLCVEAMLLALRDGVSTLVIASSDRDFSYLAEQLRENGKRVEGVGGTSTPESFRSACASFTLLLEAGDRVAPAPVPPATKCIPKIREHLARSNRPGQRGTIAWIGHCLRLGDPGFDPAAYGKRSLEEFLRSLNYFEFTTSERGEVLIGDPHLKLAPDQPAAEAATP